jgi:DNA polymerase/3'-5' exonuclease PolX
MRSDNMTNSELANRLQEHARILRRQHDNLYRVKAYRFAAEVLLRLERPVEEMIHEKGAHALEELPGIGKRLARAIAEYLETGKWCARN